MNHDFQITELNRRLANLIQLGKIEMLDLSGNLPRAKVRIGEIVSPLLPFMTQRAGNDQTWWPIDLGEQVIVFSASGNLSLGIILGSINQKTFPAPKHTQKLVYTRYSDGAQTQYDKEAHKISITLPSGGTTEIISDGGIKIVGDVELDGNIKASGDITDHTRSMEEDRNIFNLHMHAGVSRGGAVTETPKPEQ